ncbi:Crp/Fnr family transcriptional regulator [Pedobacter sandarakinus]|uniref:Crp/Fnr family transcriptional regulator n=1 Tax=Pedobacter sandarakinus TaxID=353156 RepID=UPI00224505CC|nr:Crp/Fnr family transcriptional regulator [Pedobacter sandarakinus]MCX2574468.1 Crp/Fnr family transcriptional regulator [Pedobacter sandarakinus]
MNFENLINDGFKTKKFAKNDVVYRAGTLPKYVYFIVTGEVRMVTISEDGKEFIQGIFKAGQYFGEPAIIVNRRYLAYTIVNESAELILATRAQFFQLIENTPGFSITLIQTLSNRLFYKSMMLEELANERAEHILLTLIKYLLNDLAAGESLKTTRKELADMTGLRVETVIRGVKALAKQGLITIENGKIVRT